MGTQTAIATQYIMPRQLCLSTQSQPLHFMGRSKIGLNKRKLKIWRYHLKLRWTGGKGHHRLKDKFDCQFWATSTASTDKVLNRCNGCGCDTYGTKITHEVQFYLTSLDSDALILGRAIRPIGVEILHWHWTSLLMKMLAVFVPDMHHKTCIAATNCP